MGQAELHTELLGGLHATVGGNAVEVGGARAPPVLAFLLLRSGSVVSLDRLIDAIWGENPPESTKLASLGSPATASRR
jgi:DNA-binding SARP family transcriptional activator